MIDNQEYTCPICGRHFYAYTTTDLQDCKSKGLDINPYDDQIFDQIIMCPQCGFSALKYCNIEDIEVIEYVNSPEYQVYYNDENIDTVYKKWMLAGFISKLIGQYYDSGYEFMVAGWYIRKVHGNVDDFVYSMNMAIQQMSAYVEETMEIEPALIILDLLRQIGRFEQAADFAFGLKESGIDTNTEKFIDHELDLIARQDVNEHLMEEIR